MKSKFLIVMLVLSLSLSCGVAMATPSANQGYSLATASRGSAYNIIGQKLVDMVKATSGIPIVASTTDGSLDNVAIMSKNINVLALVQNDVLHWAFQGEMMFKGKKNSRLRLLACLYDEPVFLVARKSANIKSPKDLKGHSICIGLEGSGPEAESIIVLDIIGYNLDKDFPHHIHGSYATMAKLLNEGKIDACFVTGNANLQNIRAACANTPLDIVNFPTEMLDNLSAKYPCFWYHIVPANTFDNDNLVQTPCVMAMLASDYALPDEVVNGVLTALFDKANLQKLQSLNSSAAKISLDGAYMALSVPYHRAAINFFKANGVIK